jgi:hypothetical protein
MGILDTLYSHPDSVHTVAYDDNGDGAYCVFRGDAYRGSFNALQDAVDHCNELGDSDTCCDSVMAERVRSRLEAWYTLAEDDETFDGNGICHADYHRAVALGDAIMLLTGCEPMRSYPVCKVGVWPLAYLDDSND